MDSRSLNTFIQVAETSSFTRAGEILGYSQPTISFQIKQLENELGVQLFDRIGHTINLTEEGREVLIYAQQICNMMQEMTQSASHQFTPEGNVHLGMADSLCMPLIAKEFGSLKEKYPLVSMRITPAGTDDLRRMLEHNEVDLACTMDEPIYNTAYVVVHEEKVPVHFVCGSGNPLAEKDEVTLEELMQESFLVTEKGMSYRRLLDEYLAQRDLEIKPVVEMSNADLLCELVGRNMGVSFLPDYVTEKSVKKGKVKRLNVPGIDVQVSMQLLYHRNKWLSLPMKAIIEHLAAIQLGVVNESELD